MRRLAPDEAALWKRVIETVKPLKGVAAKVAAVEKAAAAAEPAKKALSFRGGVGAGAVPKIAPPVKVDRTHPHPNPASGRSGPRPDLNRAARGSPDAPKGEGLKSNTLDGSWDRRLSRGLVSPESSIDLHGHSLASAHHRLDLGLEQAIAQGDRVLLLVTGKPPRADSERPHARGAIRAAVGDWLAGSRHASAIAAVRGAHPRHGGSGALYIVLRRPRGGDARRKS